jgi:hypothetical protein
MGHCITVSVTISPTESPAMAIKFDLIFAVRICEGQWNLGKVDYFMPTFVGARRKIMKEKIAMEE